MFLSRRVMESAEQKVGTAVGGERQEAGIIEALKIYKSMTRALLHRHVQVNIYPPSVDTILPVQFPSRITPRYASATSSTRPTFFVNIFVSICLNNPVLCSSLMVFHRSVSTAPGLIKFTRIGARSSARLRVRAWRADA